MRVFEGELEAVPGRFAVVAARFNAVITSKLVAGAERAFAEYGVPRQAIDLMWVPGSFEIPGLASFLARSREYAAVVCLGCVVRGETDHYHHVAAAAAQGIAEIARATATPVIFGVLTTGTMEQALQRAGPGGNNAGAEAACAAIRMASLMRQLDQLQPQEQPTVENHAPPHSGS